MITVLYTKFFLFLIQKMQQINFPQRQFGKLIQQLLKFVDVFFFLLKLLAAAYLSHTKYTIKNRFIDTFFTAKNCSA